MFIRLHINRGPEEGTLVNMARIDRVTSDGTYSYLVSSDLDPLAVKETVAEIESLLAAAHWPGRSDYGQ